MTKQEYEIHVKGGFSERKGLKHFSDVVQTNSLNERTRNKLYSVTEEMFENFVSGTKGQQKFVEYMFTNIFSLTKRDIPTNSNNYDYDIIFKKVRQIFTDYHYSDILTFIEGLIEVFHLIENNSVYEWIKYKDSYIKLVNTVFKEENVNYRIIDNKITDIVEEEEINSIEETLGNVYNVVKSHFQKALEHLYKTKDYDNSIKESISAVEAMCQIIIGNNTATLGETLKALKQDIHPALRESFNKLYGYASDANGIRHANGLGEGISSFSEAKYMLISCSAFINYLGENKQEEGK